MMAQMINRPAYHFDAGAEAPLPGACGPDPKVRGPEREIIGGKGIPKYGDVMEQGVDFPEQRIFVHMKQGGPHIGVQLCHPGHILKAPCGKAQRQGRGGAFDISRRYHMGQLGGVGDNGVMPMGGR